VKYLLIGSGLAFGWIGGLYSTVLFFVYLRRAFDPVALIMGSIWIAATYGFCFALAKTATAVGTWLFGIPPMPSGDILRFTGIPFVLSCLLVTLFIFFR